MAGAGEVVLCVPALRSDIRVRLLAWARLPLEPWRGVVPLAAALLLLLQKAASPSFPGSYAGTAAPLLFCVELGLAPFS